MGSPRKGVEGGARRWEIRSVVGVLMGAGLVLGAVGVLAKAGIELASPDYISAILLTLIGLSMLHAGVELLRPGVGE